jgi:sterol 3beta-glucosyltransferase
MPRVAITTIGTHGDVQPFVALARALQNRGISVVLGTTSDFREFIEGAGVEFFDLGGNTQAFLKQAKFDKVMSSGSLLHAVSLLRSGQTLLKNAAKRAWEMSEGADVMVFQNSTTFSLDIAEARGIPPIFTVFQPVQPTEEFPYFGYDGPRIDPYLYLLSRQPFAKSPSVDPFINRLSYVVQRASQVYWDMPRERLRRSTLGLRKRRKSDLLRNYHGKPLTTLHAYSPTLSPPAGDWPDTNYVTGFWRIHDDSNWQPSPELAEFLSRGEKPVYIGFGSMPWGASRNTDVIRNAVAAWGGRVIVGKGWGGFRSETLPDNVFAVDRAPHTELFKLVRAVVHHGGAGTTHTGLYEGLPTFIVPQFFDQPYWGRMIYEMGCGPPPVRIKKLTSQILAAALEDLTTTPAYVQAAQAIAAKMQLEDGTNMAVDVIEETLAESRSGAANAANRLAGAAT